MIALFVDRGVLPTAVGGAAAALVIVVLLMAAGRAKVYLGREGGFSWRVRLAVFAVVVMCGAALMVSEWDLTPAEVLPLEFAEMIASRRLDPKQELIQVRALTAEAI